MTIYMDVCPGTFTSAKTTMTKSEALMAWHVQPQHIEEPLLAQASAGWHVMIHPSNKSIKRGQHA